MIEGLDSTIGIINYLLTMVNAPEYSSVSGLLTFLSILIVSGTISHVFTRFIKSRYLGILVSSVCSIWLYEQVFVKDLSLLDILISMVLFVALLAILGLILFALFVKKIKVPLKIPTKAFHV
jgi:hypothetical protein